MKSIKPGRAPSWGGVIGGIITGFFGIFWTITAVQMGAPWPMAAFGVVFVLGSIGGAIYNYHNATSKNRFSEWDITDSNEEQDPLERPGHLRVSGQKPLTAFCPFCGHALKAVDRFCPQCGKPQSHHAD